AELPGRVVCGVRRGAGSISSSVSLPSRSLRNCSSRWLRLRGRRGSWYSSSPEGCACTDVAVPWAHNSRPQTIHNRSFDKHAMATSWTEQKTVVAVLSPFIVWKALRVEQDFPDPENFVLAPGRQTNQASWKSPASCEGRTRAQ